MSQRASDGETSATHLVNQDYSAGRFHPHPERETTPMAETKTRTAASVAAFLLFGLSGISAAGELASSAMLDPEADALLQQTSDYMGRLTSFAVDFHVIDEKIMDEGLWGSSVHRHLRQLGGRSGPPGQRL